MPPTWGSSAGYQPSPDIYGNYSSAYDTSDEYNSGQFEYPGGLRFRQSNEQPASQNQYQPAYAPPQGQGYSTTTPDPAFQNYPGYGLPQQPASNYQFRPLKKQQSKRWNGNYGQMRVNPSKPSSSYPYDAYPAPSYPSQSAAPNPLWANSWPNR